MKTIFTNLKKITRDLKNNIRVYQLALNDKRTPRPARYLLKAAIGYNSFIYDLIPDFIPILGKIDDVIILPFLVTAALQLIPQDVIDEARLRVQKQKVQKRKKMILSKTRKKK